MNERRIGLGISAILALSACNALVGVDTEVTVIGDGGNGGAGGGGGMAGAGGMGGGGKPCSMAEDCGVSDACRAWSCDAGTCKLTVNIGVTCAPDKQCTTAGDCRTVLGKPCADSTECGTGFCADRVCCDKACDDNVCYRCNASGNEGICQAIPAGQDDDIPEGLCNSPTSSCDGKGFCRAEISGSCAQNANCFTDSCNTGVATMVCTGPSGAGLALNCGPNKDESCNETRTIPGGFYYRASSIDSPAEISEVSIDRFEVTIGRFRKFLAAYEAGYKPVAGAGAHPKVPNSGWNPNWPIADKSVIESELLLCNMATPNPFTADVNAGLETRPMPCVTWYEAFAFCAWDKGRLPTEAEWNYAAAGGAAQRVYPWSNPPSSTFIKGSHATYDCNGDNIPSGGNPTANCVLADILPVGSRSPEGDTAFGHADMAGSMYEWVRDEWTGLPMPVPCIDCLTNGSLTSHVIRGGAWNATTGELRTSYRETPSSSRNNSIGFRCAYDVHPLCGNGLVEHDEICDDHSYDQAVASGCKNCDKVKKVVAGETHACVLTYLGKLKCWGDNTFGQVGQPAGKTLERPAQWSRIPLPPVEDVTLSADRTCVILKTTGEVKCFGSNKVDGVLGVLGYPATEPQGDQPGEIENAPSLGFTTKATAIASGRTHSCALLDDATVRCWGDNTLGQLGVDNTMTYTGPAPRDVFDVAKQKREAIAISASDRSTCAILMGGTVACWGSDKWSDPDLGEFFGVLGLNNAANPARGDETSEMTDSLMLSILPADAGPVSAISGAANGYCIYTNNTASVRCWGANLNGQLGRGSRDPWGAGLPGPDMMNLTSIDFDPTFIPAQIVAGKTHACVVSVDGRLMCFGSNGRGELGLGKAPPKAPDDYGIGDKPNELVEEVQLGPDRVKQISLGNQFTCALFQNDRVKCWGRNELGQTGVLIGDPSVGDDVLLDLTMAPQLVKDIPYVDPL